MGIKKKSKPGVKFYIARYNRIEEGLTGHWIFSTFTAFFIVGRIIDIGPEALYLIVPALSVSIVLAARRGDLLKYITADTAVIMINAIVIPGVIKDVVDTESMHIMGLLSGLMVLPSLVYCYYKDLGGGSEETHAGVRGSIPSARR